MRFFNRKMNHRHTALCLLTALMLCLLAAVPAAVSAEEMSKPEYSKFSDLDGKIVGMLTGAPFEDLIRSQAPGVKEFQYFGAKADMQMALKNGKIDAMLLNNAVGVLTANNYHELALMPEPLGETDFGFAFNKGSVERSRWQDAFDKIPEADRQDMWDKWTGTDESIKTIPEQSWPGENGTVRVASCDSLPPMSYRGDKGELIGYDIEMILLIAKELDVHVVFDGMEFSSVMPSVASGKALLGNGSIVISDERKETFDFVPYCPAQYVLMVRATQDQPGQGIWSNLKTSFYKTFIKDSRYQMILSGLGLTLLIGVLSGCLGLFLALGLVFIRYRNRRGINRAINVYTSLVSGIPAVVILMVLYYIVFGKIQAPAVIVAIIGFTLIFGARTFGVIWNTVGAIDSGQREAALALGYTEKQAFREIIMPQVHPRCLHIVLAQFVSLMKETSVAGFITVLELTRAGDLIRSRTMQAFFPLLSVALIYFVLTRILLTLVKMLNQKLDKKRSARLVKGVD